MTTRILFTARGLPVLQNRVFAEAAAAVDCPTGDMVLAQHLGTGLVFNTAFDPGKLRYDSDYQNEQALSPT